MRNERDPILIVLAGYFAFGTTNALTTNVERKITASSTIVVLCRVT